ncbi:hypothetical protein HMPREF9624_00521 [Oribacterium asaccharolyticum ACB7]|uniref:Glycosyl hydrolase family 43 n=1 Tax=Oribacterium asaccharolyticum ACB7 TaxID=796944 RepID=G9WU11_9FIRM|nr:glycoside hydrolase family 43 protein [Oribacterium asaccharolyticum]EHL12214.1 hypothetical protein HMPREF9624_00521 [Oribacterium asaccharolyticum ACB7]
MLMTQQFGTQTLFTIPTDLIRIRDPFIVADHTSMLYYLFGTTDKDPWNGKGEGFQVYRSRDLKLWAEPEFVFYPPKGFWGVKNFWAPEIHYYRNAWYLIASFYADGKHRGVQIFKSTAVTGPYSPISSGPVTPEDWDCLDGTLFIEENSPWLVFSHEWTQIQDGAICAIRLSDDLSTAIGEPFTLFHATDAPWSVADTGDVIITSGKNYVTDGPFLFHDKGRLKMLWSSFAKCGYAIEIAESMNGKLEGPWKHQNQPEFSFGGHGMIFETFSGERYLALHAPNIAGKERLTLVALI